MDAFLFLGVRKPSRIYSEQKKAGLRSINQLFRFACAVVMNAPVDAVSFALLNNLKSRRGFLIRS